MIDNGPAQQATDERRFARVPYSGQVNYVASGQTGAATASDVGRGGFRVRMGRYLRPGTRLMVTVPEVKPQGQPVELKAEVAWCRRQRTNNEFAAGIRVYYDAPQAMEAISEVMYHALLDKGGLWRPTKVNVIEAEGASMPAKAWLVTCAIV